VRAFVGALLFSGALLAGQPAAVDAAIRGCQAIKMTIKSADVEVKKIITEERLVGELRELIDRFGEDGKLQYSLGDRTVTLGCD
jgi:hypothetical protein